MTSLQTTQDRASATLQALRARPHPQARLQSTAFWAHTALAVDATMLLAAAGATALGAEHAGLPRLSLGWLAAFAAIGLVAARARGMYAPKLRLDVLDDLRGVVTVVSLAAMSVLAMRVLLGHDPDDLSVEVFRPWVFAAVYLAAGRIALSWTQTRARAVGEVARPALIVGAGRVGRLMARRLLDHPELGLRPIGFLDKEPLDGPDGPTLPVLGASWDLDRLVSDYGVRHVIVTFSTAPHEVLLRLPPPPGGARGAG